MTEIERTVEAFLVELEREGYATGAGLKDDANFTAIYERYPALFTHEAVAQARAAVPADRRGIAESIVLRMERHGGTAEIRSRPGAGTEVVLRLPRAAGGGADRP